MNIEANDLELLKKAVLTNSAVLFLGAGFSHDAININRDNMPVGKQFASILWDFLGYSGTYDDTPLQEIFEVALSKKKAADLQFLLDRCFKNASIPPWYSLLTHFFWSRIYTTNIDDVVETVYRSSGTAQRLRVFNAIAQDYEERDQFLEELQYVKLNGTLTDSPKSVTFSVRQYAARLADQDAWYDHFVREYSTRVTIFIGSKLNEPLLYRAIESRGKRYPGGEHRLRSFAVCPAFSPVEIANLSTLNVVPVTGSAQEFFELLARECSPLPTLPQVLLKTNPTLEGMLRIMGGQMTDRERLALKGFYASFKPVSVPARPASVRKLYLQGAEPQWNDIFNNLDAAREINDDVVAKAKELHQADGCAVLSIMGSAGSGKSTLLKRSAATLSSLGHLVFFSDCEELPPAHIFEAAVDILPEKPIVFLDNVNLAFGMVSRYLEALQRSVRKATLVVAARTHPLVDRSAEWQQSYVAHDRRIPDLTTKDIDSILDKLDENHLLGKLAGKTRHEQREVFMAYARRQILVAMREATVGSGFNEIIKDEFLHVSPVEAQMLYLCAAIPMAAQFSVRREQLIACAAVPPAEALVYIHHQLRDLLIPSGQNSESYFARHRILAELVVEELAPREMLKQAYIRYLGVLSHDLHYPADTKSRTFRLYRAVINHTSIYRRFTSDLQHARDIYNALAPHLNRDYHFWLQFGSLELEYGELDEAANYLEQAHSLSPDDDFVLTTRAQLRYKQACATAQLETAIQLRDAAREILAAQMQNRPKDHYPAHIYCAQELAWINRWLYRNADRRDALEELRTSATELLSKHGTCNEMREVVKQINNAYLDLAKPAQH